MSFLSWFKHLIAGRGRANRGAVVPVLTRADAIWLVGGLASALRRPAPRMDFSQEVGQAELCSATLDAGFKARQATVDELLEQSKSQTASRWVFFRRDDAEEAEGVEQAARPQAPTAAGEEAAGPVAVAAASAVAPNVGSKVQVNAAVENARLVENSKHTADDVSTATSTSTDAPAPAPKTVRPAFMVGERDGKYALVMPGAQVPLEVDETELRQLAAEFGLLQLTPDLPQDEDDLERFGWRWFARAFFARKKVIRDVVLASFLVSVVGLAFPLATQAIVDKVITNQATSTLMALGIGIGLMAVFSGVMGWLRQKLLLRLANVIDADLSQRVLLHLLQLPLAYFTNRPTGTLINKIHGIERIREFSAGAFLLGALELPFMLVFLALMVSYSAGLSAVVLSFLTVMVGASFIIGPILRARANESMQLGARLQGFVTERVSAVETLKSLQLEGHVARQFQTLNEAQLDATLRLREFGNGYGTFMQTTEQLMNACVLGLGAYWAMTPTSTGSSITIGMLVAFQMFAQRVTQPLLKVSGMWQELQQVRVSAKMLGEIVNQPIERYSSHVSSAGAAKGGLTVDRLSFSYAEDRPPLYENLSFTVEPGKVVLITGPSGCGKSTLAKVLLGLYTGYKGTIRLDGRDTRSMSVNEIRSLFGVVPQESVLFSGTIIENLLSVAGDATMELAVLACKMAGVHEFVENMTEGYQTKIGERGAGLSGGQRQRLAIARALIKRPKVLIFDEAVASLDAESASHVAAAVNDLAGRVTVLFITHKVPDNLKMSQHLKLG
jgi:subfamily B ATP-binding cassette protein HlyB/CyaB